MKHKLTTPLISAFLSVAIAACATSTPPPAQLEVEPTPSVKPPVSEVVVTPTRPIPDDSLLPLLVAEFALRREQLDLALDTYLTQSNVLRDPSISAHTTRLAQYLNNDKAALQAALLWVEVEPDNQDARLTLGNLLAQAGDPVAAAPHLAEVLAAGGRANFTALAVAATRRGDQQTDRLLETLNGLAKQYADNTEVMLSRAILLQHKKEYDSALDQVREVFAIDAEQKQAIVLEAQIRQLMGHKEDAFQRLQAAIASNPEDSKLRLQYARLLTRSDLEAARQQFDILVDAAPRDANLLYSTALVSRELGDDVRAKAEFERLLTLDGRHNEANFYLGRIHETAGDTRQAVSHYAKVMAGPDFQAAHRRVASLLLAEQDFAAHAAHFDKLRSRYPGFSESIFLLEADSLGQVQALERSTEALNRGLEQLPGNVSLLYARSMLSEKTRNLETMEQDLRTILAADPDNSTALNALGYTLANLTERYDEALDLIARALELNPGEPAILDSMGWVKFRLGELDTALDYLQRAFDAFPDPEVAAHLGEVLWALGEQESARDIWRESLSQHPDHNVLLDVLKRLSPGDIPAGD